MAPRTRLHRLLAVLILVILYRISVWAAPPTEPTSGHLAFPTAEGYGRFAIGGRGGKVYHINSLSTGSGSGGSCNAGGCGGSAPFSAGTVTFRDCVQDRFGVGPRTCIFRVGGLIDFSPSDCVSCFNPVPPYLTIAGQTAPGSGILLKAMLLDIRDSHDVIIRHIRSRPGPDPIGGPHSDLKSFGASTYSGLGTNGPFTQNIIFDHCSGGWANDDTTSIYYAYDVTFQWNLWSEGFENAFNGWYGKCGVIGGGSRISYIHNLCANFVDRLPYVQAGDVQMVNNVLYNAPGAINVNPWYGNIRLAVIDNYMKIGSASSENPEGVYIREIGFTAAPCVTGDNCAGGPAAYAQRVTTDTQIYVHNNYHNALRPTGAEPQDAIIRWHTNSGDNLPSYTTVPVGFPVMPTLPSQTDAATAYTQVLAKAGAYQVGDGVYATVRSDSIDQRARTDTVNGTGLWRADTPAEVGGYPTYTSGTPYVDTDGDGMADGWEDAHGLNKNDASDGPTLDVASGYSHLELFLNELAGDGATATTGVPTLIRVLR
jgi:pectate lyase